MMSPQIDETTLIDHKAHMQKSEVINKWRRSLSWSRTCQPHSHDLSGWFVTAGASESKSSPFRNIHHHQQYYKNK
jgi:hypothetical protein